MDINLMEERLNQSLVMLNELVISGIRNVNLLGNAAGMIREVLDLINIEKENQNSLNKNLIK